LTNEESVYDLVGYRITPARELSKADQSDLDVELQSLLASLAYNPPGVANTAFDLRYITTNDASIGGKTLSVILLCKLTFDDKELPNSFAMSDTKASIRKFQAEFLELLTLHLEAYEYRIAPIDEADLLRCATPFEATEYVSLTRRPISASPFRLSRFAGSSTMSRIIDMMIRQQQQLCLSVYVEPYMLDEDERQSLRLFGFESDLLGRNDSELSTLLGLEDEAVQRSSRIFRLAVRIASDHPVSQYLINLLGSEFTGRGDFGFHRANDEEMAEATQALSDVAFHSLMEVDEDKIPDSLMQLAHLAPANEASAVFRVPTERIATSRERLFKTFPAPVANLPADGLLLGYAEHPSYQEKLGVRLQTEDRRRHTYVVGKTGTGKSIMLLNMVKQDLDSDAGLCLVDPHGDLISAVMQHIPDHRIDDVVLLDPSDPDRVAGLNFLEASAEDDASEKDFLVQEVISMIIRMVDYNVEMYGPLGQQMTRMACLTLMGLPEKATLIEVPLLFSNVEYLKSVLARLEDEELKHWWQNEWMRKTDVQRNEVLGWFTSKFQSFVSAPSVRRVVGQSESTFDIRDVMDRGKILLVNLSRGRVGGLNSALLGSMVVSKILWAATQRAWQPQESRRDFYLYVDEFQNFITDNFETILSEARKYRLNLIVAHQHLAQLRAMGRLGDRVERSIFGNIGTILTFRLGTDASALANELGKPVDADTLRSLENRFAVAQLLVDDVPTTPFTMRTADYAAEPDGYDRTEKVLEAARCRNTEVSQIEAAIRDRHLA
jgi:hypothetical protein